MAACDACGTTIIFGGVKTDGFHFCGPKCAQRSPWLASAKSVAQERIDAEANAIFQSSCPLCGGDGPVDLRHVHKITSMIAISTWNRTAHLCCGKCGRKKQWGGVAHCALLGWWGIPNGLIRTPFMIGANFKAMAASKKTEPSDALKRHIRLKLAAESPPPVGPSPYVRQPGSV